MFSSQFLNCEVDSNINVSDKSLDHIEYLGIGEGKWFAEGSQKLRSCTLFRKQRKVYFKKSETTYVKFYYTVLINSPSYLVALLTQWFPIGHHHCPRRNQSPTSHQCGTNQHSHSLSEIQSQRNAVGRLFGTVGRREYLSFFFFFWLHLDERVLWQRCSCTKFIECIETIPLNFLNHSPVVFYLGPRHEPINLQDEFKQLPPQSELFLLSNNQSFFLDNIHHGCLFFPPR